MRLFGDKLVYRYTIYCLLLGSRWDGDIDRTYIKYTKYMKYRKRVSCLLGLPGMKRLFCVPD